MPITKYWDTALEEWVELDANDAKTLNGKSSEEFETPSGAQAKANTAESNAIDTSNGYTNGKISDLAGVGRTTETVKGNADAIVSAQATADAALPKNGSVPMTGDLEFDIARPNIKGLQNLIAISGKAQGFLCSNAYHTGTQWNRYDTGQPAALIVPEPTTGELEFRYAAAGANPIVWTAREVWHAGNFDAVRIVSGPSSKDINDFLDVNAMFIQDTGTSTWTNGPEGNIAPANVFYVKNIGKNSLRMTQEFGWLYVNGRVDTWKRQRTNTTWSSWYKDLMQGKDIRWSNGYMEYNDGGNWKAVGGVKKVQKGSSVLTGATTSVNVTISAVNLDKSFLLVSSKGSSYDSDGTAASIVAIKFNSTTQINLSYARLNNSTDCTAEWQVVEHY